MVVRDKNKQDHAQTAKLNLENVSILKIKIAVNYVQLRNVLIFTVHETKKRSCPDIEITIDCSTVDGLVGEDRQQNCVD